MTDLSSRPDGEVRFYRHGSIDTEFASGRADAAHPADVGMVPVGVTVLTDAGSELPTDFAEVAAVRVASLAEAGEVTLGVADFRLLLLDRPLWMGTHGPLLFR